MKWEEEFLCYSKTDFIKVLVRSSEMKTSSAERLWYRIRRKLEDEKRRIEIEDQEPIVNNDKEAKKEIEPRLHKYMEDEKERIDKLRLLQVQDLMWYSKGHLTRKMLKHYKFSDANINWLIDEGYYIGEDK